MPSPFFVSVKPLVGGIRAALITTSLLMVGCGGDGATTRTTPTTKPKPDEKTFVLTIQSPVLLKNVEGLVVDTVTGQTIASKVLAEGHRIDFELVPSQLANRRLTYLELRPTSLNNSSYYDPITDRDAAFNQSLRALVNASGTTQSVVVDPYTEIAYQRAQIRAGWFDEQDDFSQLNKLKTAAMTAAYSEVNAVFSVRNINSVPSISSRDDLSNLLSSKTQSRAFNYFQFALGHIQHYVTQQGSIASPYLAFSQKAALDMLDGDLDGMTLRGFGDRAVDLIDRPLVKAQPILNNDPNRNNHKDLAEDQLDARSSYNPAVGDAIKGLFSPLFASTSPEFKVINDYDYLNFTAKKSNGTPRAYALHSPGAGNYTRAFGLTGSTLVKNSLNADDTGLVSDIEQLAGRYENASDCQLDIRPNGQVLLTQGTLRFENQIDRDFDDSLSRPTADSQRYLINVSTPSISMPEFIQIRTDGAQVLSARAGRSLDPLPDELSQVDLSCDF
ncbi:MAG: hypothetical protein VXW65_10215 [Pseudomonadota bacterium]|nr:hypothetical protein [Pseudomonadota bacterium]